MAVELIDSHVSSTQTKIAIEALLKHARKQRKVAEETELLGAKEEHVWLVVASKKMHPEKNLKPFAIPLVHPIIDPRTTSICLITKDPQREYKDLLEKEKIKFIGRVVGVSKLKGKFKGFEARRQLLHEHGMFLADERVIPMMPQLLGKMWFEAKKQPTPVNLTRKDLKGHLERAISNTYMHQNQGTCTSVKMGTISHSHAQLYANIQKALPAIAKHIKGGWDNIQSLHIKTSTSTSLPIWTCDLGANEGGRWEGMDVVEEEQVKGDDEEVEVEEVSESDDDQKRTVRGKKRGAEEPPDDSTSKSRKKKPRPSGESFGDKKTEKEAKKAKSVSESAQSPVVLPPPSTSTEKKSKHSKKAEATAAVVPPSSSTSTEKKSKVHDKKAETTAPSTTPTPVVPPSKKPTSNSNGVADKKKSSKKATAEVETSPTTIPPVTQSAPSKSAGDDTPKPKKKSKLAEPVVPVADVTPIPIEPVSERPSKKKHSKQKTLDAPLEKKISEAPDLAASEARLPLAPPIQSISTPEKRKGASSSLENKKKKIKEQKAGRGMGRGAKGSILGVH